MTYLVELNIIKIITINVYDRVYSGMHNKRIRKRPIMVQIPRRLTQCKYVQ